MRGAVRTSFSNRCATSPSVIARPTLLVLAEVLAAILICWIPAHAQHSVPTTNAPAPTSEHGATSALKFLAGGGLALVAHEGGHLLFDAMFDANPRLKKVSFQGIPFFAITHDTMSPRREFVIDSAGFWVQEAINEVILSRRPNLRREHAPLLKGVVAFNVLASVSYAGVAFARTGPAERDTRGMADALRWREPWVGVLVLAPAILDAVRYFNPDARWAVWASRGAKIGGVALVFR
jgi:hypothetical protein